MLGLFEDWLASQGLPEAQIDLVVRLLAALLVVILSIIVDLASKRILVNAVQRVAKKTSTEWDDVLLERRVFHRLSHLAPAIVILAAAPFIFAGSPLWLGLAQRAVHIYMLVVGFSVVSAVLNAANDIYLRFPVSHRIPIKGYLQVVQIVVSIAVIILIVSMATESNPWGLLTGLGAMTAVLLLIFKDTILGLVAGVQLVANDMVRPGDWIEMQKYGADGDVIDITLNTVKVRNWDKTITTIPTYALISDSFVNWRGMQESGGRRIKRAVNIDVTSVRFCTPEMIERFSQIERLKNYIKNKREELAAFNHEHGIDETVTVNGRRMTNLGTFRAYLIEYLRHHPKIHQEMTFLVRHLEPTDKGLPVEVYVFSNDQVWGNYENIQADIFDHIFAALPQFDLRPFQSPTGHDISQAANRIAALGAPLEHSLPRDGAAEGATIEGGRR